MDFGSVDPDWPRSYLPHSSVGPSQPLHLRDTNTGATEGILLADATNTISDDFVWDPVYQNNVWLDPTIPSHENFVFPANSASSQLSQWPNLLNDQSFQPPYAGPAPAPSPLPKTSVRTIAPTSNGLNGFTNGTRGNRFVSHPHNGQREVGNPHVSYEYIDNVATQQAASNPINNQHDLNSFSGGLSGLSSPASQLRSVVDSLQRGGRLDEVNILKLRVLEKDLIISELREKLRNLEKVGSRNIAPIAEQDRTLANTAKVGQRLSPSQLKQRSNSGKITKVRAVFSEAKRRETAVARRLGACLYCRKKKERCPTNVLNPEGECMNCILVNATIHRMPCIRTRIYQVSLFHTVTTENDTWTIRPEIFNLTPSELSTAIYTECKVLEITQDYGLPLTLSVSEFIPIEGDQTSYIWTMDGAEIELAMPCYAITNIPETKAAIEAYMDKNLVRYVDYFIGRAGILVWDTFQIAMRRAHARTSVLLQKMFSLWIASRMVEKAWRICGTETLGQTLDDTASTPYRGKIPIPPVMDSQFDQIVIRYILMPLCTQVLKMLDSRISHNKREEWFETYLIVFLLLNSIELSTAHDHKFAKLHGHVASGRGSRFEDYNLVESYFHSAQVLIAHFREVVNGHLPLLAECAEGPISRPVDVDNEEAAYLEMVRREVTGLESSVLLLHSKHRYESLLYWCHQIFYQNWNPSQVYIKELDDGEAEVIGSY